MKRRIHGVRRALAESAWHVGEQRPPRRPAAMAAAAADRRVDARKRARLLVFEGPDGVGKSKLAQALSHRLVALGIDCELIAFPGQRPGSLGRHINVVHHNPRQFEINSIEPTSLQVLHVAAHIEAIERDIRPALAAGRWIILDRSWWSIWVYGLIDGVPRRSLEAMVNLELMHWNTIVPDAIFLVARQASVQRSRDGERHQRLVETYRTLAENQAKSQRVHVIMNEATLDDALQQVLSAIDDLLGDYNHHGTP